jgi:hypothetical protein
LLNRKNDSFLAQWEIDLTSKEARQQHGNEIDRGRLSEVEAEVSAVIRSKFTFCVFRVDDSSHRLELEKRMIATIGQCSDCSPSGDWLGRFSTKAKIRQSGLWLVQGLKGQAMTFEDVEALERRIGRDV